MHLKFSQVNTKLCETSILIHAVPWEGLTSVGLGNPDLYLYDKDAIVLKDNYQVPVPGHHFLFMFLNLVNSSSPFRTLTLVLIEILLESQGRLETFPGKNISNSAGYIR